MMRFLPVSLATILVELADLDETLALFASLQNDPIEGIEETVPAARKDRLRSAGCAACEPRSLGKDRAVGQSCRNPRPL